MATRDELIEAGKQALTDAWLRGVLLSQDQPGGEWHTDFGKFTATVLDAVEEKIRAKVAALASPDPEYNNAIGDVLALFDGKVSDG